MNVDLIPAVTVRLLSECLEVEAPTESVTACASEIFIFTAFFFFFFSFSALRFLRFSLRSSSESVDVLLLLVLSLSVSRLLLLGDLLVLLRRFSSENLDLDLCLLVLCLSDACFRSFLRDEERDSLSAVRTFLCPLLDFLLFFFLAASESLAELERLLADRGLSPHLLFRDLPLDLCLDSPLSISLLSSATSSDVGAHYLE